MRAAVIGGPGRHAEARRPAVRDPDLLAAGELADIAVNYAGKAPGEPADGRMRLARELALVEIGQRAVERIVDAREGVEQNVVCDHRRIPFRRSAPRRDSPIVHTTFKSVLKSRRLIG